MTDTDVLIVGAGPTGLTTAAALLLKGLDVRIVDRQAEGANTSRAAGVNARTLEVLEDLDVTRRLIKEGIQAPRFVVRDRAKRLLSIDFTGLQTAYPFTLLAPQSTTERLLLDRVRELGGDVTRPKVLTTVTQDDAGVTATFCDGDVVRSRYLVGADGMHSTVRDQAGIGFTGGAYEQSFVLADARLTGDAPTDEVRLFWAGEGLTVVAPLPNGTFRVVAPVDDAPERPSVPFVQALLDARGPGGLAVTEVTWGSRFRVHHRVADTYRAGRVLLAGDAAHVHSPAGGQGMNLGIQDAVRVGRRPGSGAPRRFRCVAGRLRRHPPADRATGHRPDRSTHQPGHPAPTSSPGTKHVVGLGWSRPPRDARTRVPAVGIGVSLIRAPCSHD